MTSVTLVSTAWRNHGCSGSGWRGWFPGRPITAAVEAPALPAAPVTPALSPGLTAALGRGSGLAVSESAEQKTQPASANGWIRHFLLQHFFFFFFPPPSASSKSEGSALQRPENAGKKPDDRREFVRPSRPAVRDSDE